MHKHLLKLNNISRVFFNTFFSNFFFLQKAIVEKKINLSSGNLVQIQHTTKYYEKKV